ncbi:MAG: tagaturonate epimerase family protein, partial [Candidatus Bipolaricaulia bacterium]
MASPNLIKENLGSNYNFYENSFQQSKDTSYSLVKKQGSEEKNLAVFGPGREEFSGEELSEELKLCPPSWENAQALMGKFDWLVPSLPSPEPSFGFGDRTGLATPGHKRALDGHDAFPVF